MALPPGTHLGPYEIVSALGAGGMGEVYQARDTRLFRSVAVKILPPAFSTDNDRLRRFELEAKVLSGLNHPNILGIFDVGAQGDIHFLVSELLDGETLRHRLRHGRIPLRKMASLAVQIAHGLAAAHEKGVIHRDLKPENIFVTVDARIKILDFGLAKQDPQHPEPITGSHRTPVSEVGSIHGTVGYMSPEQIRGRALDARSDIFSLGAILYEMITGHRAFHGDSAIETMNSILKDEPPEISSVDPNASPSVEKLVCRCLEKDRAERFQSARDLAFALEAVSGSNKITEVDALRRNTPTLRHTVSLNLGIVVAWAALTVVALAFLWFLLTRQRSNLDYQQLTFRRGAISNARFAPGEGSVVYSAQWNNEPMQIYSTSTLGRSRESRRLGAFGWLQGVSSKGDMALIVSATLRGDAGTLAIMPVEGGTPRELVDGITAADISPGGADFAVVRVVNGQSRLEFPLNHVLYQGTGDISNPRISPDGKMVAFDDHPTSGDDRGYVAVVSINGEFRRLTSEWSTLQALAWVQTGKNSGTELWYSGGANDHYELRSVSLAGKHRLVWRIPSQMQLTDIGSDGRILLDVTREDRQVLVNRELQPDKDFSGLHSDADPLIPETRGSVIFTEAGLGDDYSVMMRKLNDEEPVELGSGYASSISNDGKWVLAQQPSDPTKLRLLPTGAGTSFPIEIKGLIPGLLSSRWMPSDQGFYFVAAEPGHPARTWRMGLDSSKPEPVSPEGIVGIILSPDGKTLIVRDYEGNLTQFDINTQQMFAVVGTTPDDECLNWDNSGLGIYVTPSHNYPIRIDHLDLKTGARQPWRTLNTDNPTGVLFVNVSLPRAGDPIAHSSYQVLSELYLVSGLK